MKKYLSIVLFLLSPAMQGAVHAQSGRPGSNTPQIRREMMEKIKAAKWAFLIYRLNLNEERTNKLLPVYEAYEADKRAIFQPGARPFRQHEGAMTDEQAEKLMNTRLENAKKLLALKEQYKGEFLKVLSPAELLHLQNAEQEFAAKIQMERQKRRRNDR